MLILLNKSQLDLFGTPTYVHGHVRKDGVQVAPHVARRRKRITASKAPPMAAGTHSKLDGFITKHGGADHLRATLLEMTAEQRAKLIDAMAHLEDIEPRDVISKLGMREEAASGDSESVSDSPVEPATTEPAAAEEQEPKEGNTKTEDGVDYVLRDGRWHRAVAEVTEEPPAAAPESDPEVEAIEDRQDLAEAMDRDPHSEETRALIKKVAARDAPKLPPPDAPGDDLDPSSPNYRYRDTGYVAGSRKEMASTMIRRMARAGETVRETDIDWDALEANPREAKELIVKDNLFGALDWTVLREAGMDPGAAFIVSKVYAAISTKPADDTPLGRRDYSLAMTTVRDRMEACRSVDDVTALLAEIRAERDGELLNEQERGLYARAMEFYNERNAQVRALDAEAEGLAKRVSALSGEVWKHKADLEKRKRRGWKTDPEVEALVVSLEKEEAEARAAAVAFREASGMVPITHRTQTSSGISTRFEYPYRAEVEQARGALAMVKQMARARNAAENPLTRAWRALGGSFSAVLDYRAHKGSEAFGKHVATVKAGRVTTWDWAEKKSEPRGASKRSTSFQLHVADKVERSGGRPIDVGSTEQLKSTFNLREVQSGNWVLDDPNSAKFHVEACAGAFADLGDLLGIEDGKLSFNGRLAMAFGARGKGGAKAHYEPVERVINMTKMAGAGSLAHEWFHCVDNLVKEAMTGLPSDVEDFATEHPALVDHPELQAAFRELSDAMLSGPHRQVVSVSYTEAEEKWAASNMAVSYGGRVREAIKAAEGLQAAVDAVDRLFEAGSFGPKDKRKSKNARDNWRKIAVIHHGKNDKRLIEYETGPGMSMYLIDATHLDQGTPGKYWSQPKEMAARAFSSFVEDKLAEAGRSNTYLVSDANNNAYRAMGEPHRPFAESGERERMNAAFEKLFGLIKSEDVLAKALAAREAPLS